MEPRLYPQARAAVAAAAAELPVHDPAFDVASQRAEARVTALAEPREPMEGVRDVDADGVPARLYLPAGRRPGVLVHLHGGGFVMNDVEVHDNAARRLADRAGLATISVEYRRPPEHPFPAAPDDVDTVLAWLEARAVALDLDGPAYVHGDSAGANLALVAALRHPARFTAVALTYPFLDPRGAEASYDVEGVGFDRAQAEWYWRQYARTPADFDDPDLAPLRSDRLGSLPPTLVVTADADPLRDEGERLAALLAESGVVVTATRYLGQVHGFWRHPDVFDAAEPLTRQLAGFLAAYR